MGQYLFSPLIPQIKNSKADLLETGMDIFFSTVVRTAPSKESGELVRLNWDTKQIVAKTPMYPDQPEVDDPNPRGNTRGGRGILVTHDRIVCASYHTLKFF